MNSLEALESVRTLKYDSWGRFKSDFARDLCRNPVLDDGRFLFRGQQSSSWPLIPSFDRVYSSTRLEERHGKAEALLASFRQMVEKYSPADFASLTGSTVSPVEFMAVAQHYGLPTRLLDWSWSPYVAAYFAYSDLLINGALSKDAHIAIWVLDTSSKIWGSESGVCVHTVSPKLSDRIRNQGGAFSHAVVPVESLEEYHAQMAPTEAALSRFLVPTSEAAFAVADLRAMDIHHARLFPGLEGCVSAARINVPVDA